MPGCMLSACVVLLPALAARWIPYPHTRGQSLLEASVLGVLLFLGAREVFAPLGIGPHGVSLAVVTYALFRVFASDTQEIRAHSLAILCLGVASLVIPPDVTPFMAGYFAPFNAFILASIAFERPKWGVIMGSAWIAVSALSIGAG